MMRGLTVSATRLSAVNAVNPSSRSSSTTLEQVLLDELPVCHHRVFVVGRSTDEPRPRDRGRTDHVSSDAAGRGWWLQETRLHRAK